ncbi:serine/threonine-protein kinase [Spirilliplanes yamanashiensis]|uniref:Protein kinase domain-containing protein n=1 Tax=Spirilliplanes yamanashiensis TaxID=42233 RepID=A0A8J3Y5H5_9ACTN|nr:serine/threonine-protein kinase [Spirilliplanes yamanashiensis]MDP9819266.1 serine/threonine-protein kinase [Spirilliplanes yamanashiensis]GIJ01910.1 hypothetical protein Sya03_12620 [Spirilliplanes yamanashiensis]
MESAPTTGTRSHDPATLDLGGRCVGNSYILIRPVGHGATGTVWRAVDRGSGEQVAVKLLHESLLRQPKLVTRFVQERTILLMLRHRHVVRVRDLFSVNESLGLVMDLVAGGSLRGHLRERGTLAAADAARLAGQVAAALTEAHAMGIVHRDLKPDNILLTGAEDGGEPETRLTDFGIARVLSTPGLTTPHAVVGTPYYMAPEAFHGAPTDPKVDVYALGVVLYELVVGHPPYVEDSIPELMRRHLEDRPERPDGLPDDLWSVVEACMHRDARKRPTAADLVGMLAAVARTATGVAALPAPDPRPATELGSAQEAPPAAPPASPAAPAAAGPAVPQQAAPVSHPSLPGSAQPPPQRRNQAPSWRWVRPGLFSLLIVAAMLGSGVAASAWQTSRAEAGRDEALTLPAAPGPAGTHAPQPTPTGPRPTAAAVTMPASADRLPPGGEPVADRPVRKPAGKASPAPARTTTRPARVPEATPWGPYECRDLVSFTFGFPMLAKPCHSLGTGIRATAAMAAAPGTTARVSVRLQNAATGATAGGSRTCGTLSFTKEGLTQRCGPVEFAAPRGHRYVLVMTWQHSHEGKLVLGSAKGEEFAW